MDIHIQKSKQISIGNFHQVKKKNIIYMYHRPTCETQNYKNDRRKQKQYLCDLGSGKDFLGLTL